LIQRRIRHEPIAYITGHREFFGIEFYLDPRVAIPRPETELLVEQALELANSRFPRSCIIADIGTGCGAIAIALASNLTQAKVYATDISAPALEVAAMNCQRHSLTGQVQLLQGDLLDPIPEPVHLVVANLPYVRDSEIAELSAESRLFEPMIALAGGDDGLKWIRKLLSQAGAKINRDGAILIEIGYDQGLAVTSLAREAFPGAVIRIIPDLDGHDRVVLLEMI
jgi:release factor glutamine methyltransferase